MRQAGTQGTPASTRFGFFLLSSCTYYGFTAFVCVSVCLSVFPFFYYSLSLIRLIFIMHVSIKAAYGYVKNVYSLAKK